METGIEASGIQSESAVPPLGGQLDLDEAGPHSPRALKAPERRPELKPRCERSRVELARLDSARPCNWIRDGRDGPRLLDDLAAGMRRIRRLAEARPNS